MRFSAICLCGYETPLVDNEEDIDYDLLHAHQEFCKATLLKPKMLTSSDEELINLDKYEGHTKGDNEVGWRISDNFIMNDISPNNRFIAYVQPNEDEDKVIPFSDADSNLIADAPLLLVEIKRLRKQLDSLREFCHKEDYDIYNWEVKNIEVKE